MYHTISSVSGIPVPTCSDPLITVVEVDATGSVTVGGEITSVSRRTKRFLSFIIIAILALIYEYHKWQF